MGKSLNESQIKALQVMFEDSGAIAFGRQGIIEYSQKARDILEKTELNEKAKEGILALIKKMEKLEH
jgi:geranylgeranyl pyrophosphate synthase